MANAVIGALRVDLDLGVGGWTAGLSRAEVQADKAAARFAKIGASIRNVGMGMTAAFTAPLVLFAKQAATVAMDAEELQSAFNATFGAMADDMNKWAIATGDALGRSTREIQEGANAFGLYFNQAAKTREEAAEMSKQFTVLAQDLASFHNTGVDEALLALRSGLSGESEPLRRFGVFLNDAAVKAKALEMGLKPVGKNLTDQQKIMARAAIIMEKTATAQGDVARTADSSANRLRASQAAWEELQITVGTKVLPAFTPVLAAVTGILEAFNTLDPSMQTVVVGFVAFAAALGPVLTVLGPVVAGLGALTASLSASAVAAGGWGAVLAPALPVLAALAAAAAAAYLVWKNWDTIAPILKGLWGALVETLGPPLINLFEAVKAAALALWNSAFVQGIVTVLEHVARFQMAVISALGSAVPGVLRALAAVVGSVFDMIAEALNFIVSVLSGDWEGAWSAAQGFVAAFARGVSGLVGGLVEAVVGFVSSMVRSIDQWMGGRLSEIWNRVKAGVDKVIGYFRGMWDAVVGHSFVPDMVDGIARQIARLDSVMVDRTKKATLKTAEAFKALADEVTPLLERLFPEAASLRQYRQELELLDKALAAAAITADQYHQARMRLAQERGRADYDAREARRADVLGLLGGDEPIADTSKLDSQLGDFTDRMQKRLFDPIKNKTAEAAEHFAGMARDVLGSLRGMVDAFKGGDILGGITGLLDMVMKVTQIIRGVSSPAPSVNVNGSYGGGRAFGGPVVAGKRYRVGEQGPEWFTPTQNGRISANDDGPAGGNVYHISGNLLTPEFWAQIQAMDDEAAARGSLGGAQLAAQANERRARYSLGGGA